MTILLLNAGLYDTPIQALWGTLDRFCGGDCPGSARLLLQVAKELLQGAWAKALDGGAAAGAGVGSLPLTLGELLRHPVGVALGVLSNDAVVGRVSPDSEALLPLRSFSHAASVLFLSFLLTHSLTSPPSSPTAGC